MVAKPAAYMSACIQEVCLPHTGRCGMAAAVKGHAYSQAAALCDCNSACSCAAADKVFSASTGKELHQLAAHWLPCGSRQQCIYAAHFTSLKQAAMLHDCRIKTLMNGVTTSCPVQQMQSHLGQECMWLYDFELVTQCRNYWSFERMKPSVVAVN